MREIAVVLKHLHTITLEPRSRVMCRDTTHVVMEHLTMLRYDLRVHSVKINQTFRNHVMCLYGIQSNPDYPNKFYKLS